MKNLQEMNTEKMNLTTDDVNKIHNKLCEESRNIRDYLLYTPKPFKLENANEHIGTI